MGHSKLNNVLPFFVVYPDNSMQF